jgi:hypothetical protein
MFALLDELQAKLEQANAVMNEAVLVCERIDSLADAMPGDSAWQLAATQARMVRKLLPGGDPQAVEDALRDFERMRAFVESDARRSA